MLADLKEAIVTELLSNVDSTLDDVLSMFSTAYGSSCLIDIYSSECCKYFPNQYNAMINQIAAIYIRDWYSADGNKFTTDTLNHYVSINYGDENYEKYLKRLRRQEASKRKQNNTMHEEFRANGYGEALPEAKNNRLGRRYDMANLIAIDSMTKHGLYRIIGYPNYDDKALEQKKTLIDMALDAKSTFEHNDSQPEFADAYKDYYKLYDVTKNAPDNEMFLAHTINLLRLESHYHFHLIAQIAEYREKHDIKHNTVVPYIHCFWSGIATVFSTSFNRPGITEKTYRTMSYNVLDYNKYIPYMFTDTQTTRINAFLSLYRRYLQSIVLRNLRTYPSNHFIPHYDLNKKSEVIQELVDFFKNDYPFVQQCNPISLESSDDKGELLLNTTKIKYAKEVFKAFNAEAINYTLPLQQDDIKT